MGMGWYVQYSFWHCLVHTWFAVCKLSLISGGSFVFLLERCNETSHVHCLFLVHSKEIFVFLDVYIIFFLFKS